MATEWFYQVAGETRGPVSAKELRGLAERGAVTPDAPVRRGNDGKWVPAGRVKGLFESGSVGSPESPPAPPGGPPPVPPPVSVTPKPPALGIEDAEGARRLRGMRPMYWMLAGGGVLAALVVVVGSVVFFGGNSGSESSEMPVAENGSGAERILEVGSWKDAAVEVVERPDEPKPLSPADVYAKAAPAVVIIRSVRRQDSQPLGLGSGFVAEPGDVIVTNEHVIRGASHLEIRTHEGQSARVTGVLAVDEERDVAVLPLPASLRRTPSLKLGSSAPRVGDAVYAIGAPKGLDFTFTTGVVSQIRRNEYGTLIQHDASVSPGSSGGPLVNRRAEVVGVNTLGSLAKAEAHNLNFAVSSSTLKSCIARATTLLEQGSQVAQLAELYAPTRDAPTRRLRSDDQNALHAVRGAVRKADWGTALSLLARIPNTRRGREYWSTAAHVQEQLGNLTDAYDAYEMALAGEADSETWLKLAFVAEQLARNRDLTWRTKGDYFETALRACEAAVQLDPQNARAYNLRGVMHMFRDRQKAIGALNTAIALEPDHLGARYNLGMLYLWINDYTKAANALESALRFIGRASEYRIVSLDESEPVTELTSSRSIAVLIHLAAGYVHHRQGRFADSIQHYRRVLAVEPNNAVACWGICQAYRSWRGDLEDADALEWQRRAQRLDPSGDRQYNAVTLGGSPYIFCK